MNKALPVCAAAATGIFVGATIVATCFVIDQTDPASLALLRYAIGFLCLLPPALLAGPLRFQSRDVLPIALLGVAQFGILVALLNFGLLHISSALGAIIFATFPLLTLLLAASLRLESMSAAKVFGILATLLGVALALGDQLTPPGPFGQHETDQSGTGPSGSYQGWIGEAAVFASALTGAICSVLYRPYLRRYPVLQVSAVAMLASVAFLAVLAAWEGFFTAAPAFTASGWAAVVFIGVSSGLGYYCWLWALRHTEASRVAVFLALSPITATLLGALLLEESVSLIFLCGLAFVVLGIWLAYRQPRA